MPHSIDAAYQERHYESGPCVPEQTSEQLGDAMKHSRNLVGAYLTAALLAACGGGNASMSIPAVLRHSSSQSETFNYTGSKQKFVVPSYVTAVTITAAGASGGGSGYNSSYYYGPGGVGGWVQATIPVTAGEKLVVSVGGSGDDGGFNGGGAGGFRGVEVPRT